MSTHKRHWRAMSLILVVAMLFSILPTSIFAENAATIWGDRATIEIGSDAASNRETNFNKDWKFYLGTSSTAQNKGFDDSSWDDVSLPHDYSIFQNFTTSGEAESGFLPGGTGWYRKTFTMPAEDAGKTVLLNFDGVYMEAYVYVNGTFVGEHHYGYTAFAFDITDYLTCDGATENVIAVKTVNTIPSSRWYSGSGIYRDVTLIVTDPVHVDLNGTHVTTPNISSGNGTVKVEVDVVNDGSSSASVTVSNTVYKKGSETALASANTTVTVSAGGTATATSSPVVSNPALWSVENPNLYTVVTELMVGGEVVDTYETEFGFRWVNFSSDGFSLNGVNVKLNGVCMHHDQGALGSAAYHDAIYRQMTILKDMGCNAIRTAHNPADESLISICNELGLLVIEEAFDGLNEAKNGNSYDFARYYEASVDTALYGASSGMTCAEFAARSMVKRDRNAPSVFAWSFGNEIQEGTYWNTVSQFAGFCANFIEWINEEDGTRIVTSGDNNRGGNSNLIAVLNTIINAGGVCGFNYANSSSELYSLLQSYGGNHKCIIASETSSHVNSRGFYKNQYSASTYYGYHLTSYDTSAVSWGITAHDSIYNTYQYDGVAGEFVWTGFDYIGEPTPWNGTGTGTVSAGSGATPNSSYFGMIDTAGFEKDTYYLYRSQWNKNETTLHLVTAWDSDNMMTSSSKTPVWVYSNAPVVKLYRDGTLIGTATRTANTSAAGHTYYTYTTSSSNTSICTTSSGSGADGLYAVFNVAYTSGTLSAKAFDENGNEIALSSNSGKNTVTTPGTVSALALNTWTREDTVTADGSSLIYVAVDVTDASGNLDTTASNNIVFSLSGPGKIMGVDNGNQATTAKYQQSSVLTSDTSANINAYAGKALVIIRTTEEAGTITLNVSSSGLTGGSVTITTMEAADTVAEGLVRYSVVKDYTIKAGTVPTLDTAAIGNMADGSTVNGTIAWETVAADVYNTAGDYTINGTLTFAGYDAIPVTARLHVIPDIVALRNVSTATTSGVVPALPSTVSGVLANGTLAGEFTVAWETVSADALATVGDIVTVNGTAAVFGSETLPVTCTIRVAQAVQSESTNVAPMANSLSQDIAASNQSDNLESIRNGTLKPGDNTSERWTNWRNRTTSANATLTFTWATAQMLNGVNIYYYYDNCCAYPESIVFSYSLDGSTFISVEATATQVETYSLGAQYSYTFAEPINPVALKVIFTQQNGTSGSSCVGVTELEIMTYAAELQYNTSADLSGITVDGTAVSDFAANVLNYTASGSAVAATSDANAAITVLPAVDNVVRILTLSEDGSAAKTYAVALTSACKHTTTETRNASAATCTADGYTGDTYCTECNALIAAGTVITASGHDWSDWTETKASTCTEEGTKSRTCGNCQLTETNAIAATGHQHTEVRGASSATCTVSGYTGDTWCTDCETKIAAGSVIAATGHQHTEVRGASSATCTVSGYTGDTWCTDCETKIAAGAEIPVTEHSWDEGVITTQPTEDSDGVKLHTCVVCGETKTESVPYEKVLKAPAVSLTVSKNTSTGRIVMTAKVNDYANLDDYYEITSHGIVFIYSSRLGSRVLTVNTAGRTKVNFGAYNADGSYVYNYRPVSRGISYTIRAYISYVDPDTGKTVYVYSDPISTSYNKLS